jgi:radical SAM superfamily enzyme YgiQ (UPF0313 family)
VEEEPISALLAREQFDIVGVSSPTPLIYEAWEVAALAKAQGAITILGGPHPTLMPEESMERPEVDLVVRGEAEETLVEIVREIERQQAVLSPRPGVPDQREWREWGQTVPYLEPAT